MTSSSELLPARGQGWRMGLANLFRKEISAWWGTRRWLLQSVLWIGLLNGLVAILLWFLPADVAQEMAGEGGIMLEGLKAFVQVGSMILALGTVIITQGALIDEKQTGTAAWVLSKPVSRAAFFLSKFFANELSLLIIALLVPGVFVYLQLAWAGQSFIPIPAFLKLLGVMAVNLTFYLSLTLTLGTFFSARGPVLALPIAVLFGDSLAPLAPWLLEVMPWGLPSLGLAAGMGVQLPTITPIMATLAWILILMLAGLWRLHRQQF